ncbi:hypothetical protein ACHIPZ_21420 [Antrihabitans sp. NCIMB 15449]|uniref:Uncharacterized protein n=1 Tax=Antrihabitans spumae TaxID=3373370 RepID=A0ABW7JRU8_9NOCA
MNTVAAATIAVGKPSRGPDGEKIMIAETTPSKAVHTASSHRILLSIARGSK